MIFSPCVICFRPRLGAAANKVVAAGVIYFVLALVERCTVIFNVSIALDTNYEHFFEMYLNLDLFNILNCFEFNKGVKRLLQLVYLSQTWHCSVWQYYLDYSVL